MSEVMWVWDYELKTLGSWPSTGYNGHNTPVEVVTQMDVKALRDERDRLARAIVWALGYTDFRAREPGEGPYWWRTELRLRAKLTGEQIDAILAALTPAGGRAG